MPAESDAAAGGSGSSGGAGNTTRGGDTSTSRTLTPGAGAGADAGTHALNAPVARAMAHRGRGPIPHDGREFLVIFRGMVTA